MNLMTITITPEKKTFHNVREICDQIAPNFPMKLDLYDAELDDIFSIPGVFNIIPTKDNTSYKLENNQMVIKGEFVPSPEYENLPISEMKYINAHHSLQNIQDFVCITKADKIKNHNSELSTRD